MNNNIKDTTSLVFVKGRNLIDSSKIIFGSVASGTGVYGYYNYSAITDYIPIEAGSYYLKLFNPGSGSNAISVFRITGYDSNKNYLWDDTNLDVTERIITGISTKYIRICFKKGNYQTMSSLQDIINSNPQLEAGSSATSYKPYVEKEILIKNKNGVFEKFLGEPKEIIEIVKTCTTGQSAHHGYYYVDLNMRSDGININNLININAKVSGNALFLYQWISDTELRIRTNTANTDVILYLLYIV